MKSSFDVCNIKEKTVRFYKRFVALLENLNFKIQKSNKMKL